jgi:hypothetical protein
MYLLPEKDDEGIGSLQGYRELDEEGKTDFVRGTATRDSDTTAQGGQELAGTSTNGAKDFYWEGEEEGHQGREMLTLTKLILILIILLLLGEGSSSEGSSSSTSFEGILSSRVDDGAVDEVFATDVQSLDPDVTRPGAVTSNRAHLLLLADRVDATSGAVKDGDEVVVADGDVVVDLAGEAVVAIGISDRLAFLDAEGVIPKELEAETEGNSGDNLAGSHSLSLSLEFIIWVQTKL